MAQFDNNTATMQETALPADDTAMQLELKRRLKMAEALQQQAMPEGQMVSGHYVAPSWTQYLANAYGKYQGGKQEREALGQYSEYKTAENKRLADALSKFGKAFEPTTTTNTTYAPGVGKELEIGDTVQIAPNYSPTSNANEMVAPTSPYGTKNMTGNAITSVPITTTSIVQPTDASMRQAFNQYIIDTKQPKLAEQLMMSDYEAQRKRNAPYELAAGASRFEGGTNKLIATNPKESPESVSSLGRLQNERARLVQTNPNDPRIKEIDNAIRKETTFAPAANTYVNMPKVETSARIESNQDFSKNVYRPTLDSAAKNSIVLSRLDALEKLPINEQTGWGTQAKAAATNVLLGLGYNNEEAKSLASNAQTFKAIQARQVNEELNAAKGPQTEGDAQRAASAYASLGNTPQANQFINSLQRAIIKRKNAEAAFYRKNYNSALQAGDLSQLERDWMDSPEAAKSIFDYPEMKTWTNASPSNNAQPKPAPSLRWNPNTNKLERM